MCGSSNSIADASSGAPAMRQAHVTPSDTRGSLPQCGSNSHSYFFCNYIYIVLINKLLFPAYSRGEKAGAYAVLWLS